MLETGVHFGHKKERSHPRMKDYIYTLRDGVYVIDLEKTKDLLEKATAFLKRETQSGKTILFVGTKRQARDIVMDLAEKLGAPYVIHRWLGGTLTNFETVRKSLNELERLEAQMKTTEFEALTKKEKKLIEEKQEKLLSVFGGIRQLKSLPDAIFVVDANREKIVLEEASRMNIPVVGMCDTDADPTKITYPIPSNDEAAKAIELILGSIQKELLSASAAPVEKPLDSARGKEEVVEKTEEKVIEEAVEEVKSKPKETVQEKTKKETKKVTKPAKKPAKKKSKTSRLKFTSNKVRSSR